MKKLLLLLALLGLATPAAAQNPFSLINFGSTAVDTNGGNKSNGTLRVTLATDGTNPTTVFKIDLSGTSANATAIKVDGSAVTQPVSGTFWQATQPVSGTVAVSTAFLLDATFTGRTPAGASPADGESNTITTLSRVGAFHFVFNGTTWDRVKGAANALNSTGTGIPTAQIVGQFDDVAPTAITENQFGNLRMSANRNLYGTIRDAAGNERGANVSAGNALLVDASATTQPISAASLPLPSLAATSTKQSDGTQKTQIVDGSGNVIAATSNNLNVQCANCSGSGVSATDEATFTGGASVFAAGGGFFQTTATNNALTTGQQGAFQVTANRALFSNLRNAAGTEVGTSTTPFQVTLANTGANTNKLLVTPDSVALPANQSVNVNQLAGTTTDTNSGNKSAGTLRVVLATDQPALTNKLLVTPDSVALPANQSVNVSQMNGVTTSMNTGSPDTGTQRVVDADGVSECAIVSAASTNATNCKAGAGNFLGLELYNTTTTVYYLRLYNTVGAPTCSSATGFIRSIPVPPAAAAGQVGGAIVPIGPGVAYGTGVAFCLTGGSSSTDNTNAAVGIFGAIKYR